MTIAQEGQLVLLCKWKTHSGPLFTSILIASDHHVTILWMPDGLIAPLIHRCLTAVEKAGRGCGDEDLCGTEDFWFLNQKHLNILVPANRVLVNLIIKSTLSRD